MCSLLLSHTTMALGFKDNEGSRELLENRKTGSKNNKGSRELLENRKTGL